MNDYFAGWLAKERQSDYLREVAKDERAAACRPARQRDGWDRRLHLVGASQVRRLLMWRPQSTLHVHVASPIHLHHRP